MGPAQADSNTTQNKLAEGSALATKADQPNLLSDLTNAQFETFDLVQLLESRVQPVSYSEPVDSNPANAGSPSLHIGYNFENQQTINSRLRRILKSLVV